MLVENDGTPVELLIITELDAVAKVPIAPAPEKYGIELTLIADQFWPVPP